ncbi:tripartite motif-containing protein 45-like [Patiria miniata]|uniref:Uncharacterized protein n=1 Tax=Patiria miniata TaxID=46514 RepID=A0A914A4B8_PATMI|nr:tripartite motif-containing protein 45-like [Patiria miniata]
MATGVTVESVLGSIQSHLECSICHTRYQEPKMLDCSHSFCLRCLQELKQSQTPDDGKITCPLCQRQTILPEGGVTKLNKNYTLVSLVDEVSKQEQILKGGETEGPAVVVCQACDEEHEATVQCIDCEQFLCRECHQAHLRFKSMKTHKITVLLNQRDDVLQTETKKNASNCDIHPSQKLCLYCTTCEKLICKECMVSGHKDPMHMRVDVNVAFDRCLKEVHKTYGKVGRFDTHVSQDWEYSRTRLSRMLVETKRDISSEAVSKVAEIRRQEMQLLQEADAVFMRKDRRLAELIFAQHAMKKTDGEITDRDRLEILKLRQDLLSEYKDVKEKTWEEVNSHLSFIPCKEKCHEIELGTLKLEEKWKLMKAFEATGSSVATFSTGNIAMAYGKRITILGLNDQEEYYIHESKETHLLNNPSGMAVTMDDVLFVANNDGTINKFNKEYQLLQQFKPSQEADIKATPTCIAVDNSNLIAVGYGSKDKISLHNPDGSLIRTLPAPMIGDYLTISNKQLIYTNKDKKKLMCLDYHGNNIFTVDSFENSAPHGLCCDKAGDIYVAAYCQCIGGVKESEYQIHRYSAEGIYIDTSVKHSLSRSWPIRIAYTPNGRIVVIGCYNLTKIYHRV